MSERKVASPFRPDLDLHQNFLSVWYTWPMNEKYTLQLKSVGDHLEVTIPELNITVETAPGKTSRDDALDVAHTAIEKWTLQQRRREQETVKAS